MSVMRQKVVTIIAALLVASGVVLLTWQPMIAHFIRRQGQVQNTKTLQQTSVIAQKNLTLGMPAQVTVPRLGIEVRVLPGTYNTNGTWAIDRVHAFAMAPASGQTPTPIIYGHAIPEVFRPLEGVARNEPLIIMDSDGNRYLFAYVSDIKVAPTDTAILQQEMPNTVLLMTCTGARFEQRRILQFRYIGVQPPVVFERFGHGTVA